MHATHSGAGIRVINMRVSPRIFQPVQLRFIFIATLSIALNPLTCIFRKVSSLLYGGDNVTVPDPNPEKSAKFRVKLGQAYAFPLHCCIPVRSVTDPAGTSTPPLGLAPPILTSSWTMMDAERSFSSGCHLKLNWGAVCFAMS
jgi:hypothetical protein